MALRSTAVKYRVAIYRIAPVAFSRLFARSFTVAVYADPFDRGQLAATSWMGIAMHMTSVCAGGSVSSANLAACLDKLGGRLSRRVARNGVVSADEG